MTEGLNPELVEKVNRVLAAMQALGFPMHICQGFRTVAEQQALYAKGRTAPGPIVTKCDGIVNQSRHQSGRAVDCCFSGGEGADPWTGPWDVYGGMGQAVGLEWGGNFKTLVDRPHLELKA